MIKKDHRKTGESEHNTNCDATVGITTPHHSINRPCSRQAPAEPIRSSAGVVNKQARTTAKIADHGNKCNVPGCAGDVKCRDGLVSLFRKVQKANNRKPLKGHVNCSLLLYIRFHLPHKQSKERWGWRRMIYRSWAPLISVWSCEMCSKCCCSII